MWDSSDVDWERKFDLGLLVQLGDPKFTADGWCADLSVGCLRTWLLVPLQEWSKERVHARYVTLQKNKNSEFWGLLGIKEPHIFSVLKVCLFELKGCCVQRPPHGAECIKFQQPWLESRYSFHSFRSKN